MLEGYPDYPIHAQMPAYFQDDARHFQLESYICFNSAASGEMASERWRLTSGDDSQPEFDCLVIANGTLQNPVTRTGKKILATGICMRVNSKRPGSGR